MLKKMDQFFAKATEMIRDQNEALERATRRETRMLKKMDQFFAKATEMILDYNERQQKHHCVLEENKASHDPRFCWLSMPMVGGPASNM